MSISVYKYSMLQPQMAEQFQRGAVCSLPKSLITILHKARGLRDCAITIPAIITDCAVPTQLNGPSKRSLVCNSSSSNNTHKRALRQASSYTCLQDATSQGGSSKNHSLLSKASAETEVREKSGIWNNTVCQPEDPQLQTNSLFPSWNKVSPNLSSLPMSSAGEKHPRF